MTPQPIEQITDTRRLDLLRALAEMPDEAFTYFVAWARGCRSLAGEGSFRVESEAAFRRVELAAAAYRLRMRS